jgi:hypothetical protein
VAPSSFTSASETCSNIFPIQTGLDNRFKYEPYLYNIILMYLGEIFVERRDGNIFFLLCGLNMRNSSGGRDPRFRVESPTSVFFNWRTSYFPDGTKLEGYLLNLLNCKLFELIVSEVSPCRTRNSWKSITNKNLTKSSMYAY